MNNNFESKMNSNYSPYFIKEIISFNPKYIGVVIGVKGCNIKKISKDFNVSVHINDTTKEISVKGRSKQNVDDAIKFIREIMSDKRTPPPNRNPLPLKPFNFSRNTDEHVEEFKPVEEVGIAKKKLVLGPIDWEEANRKVEEYRKLQAAKLPKMLKNFYREVEEISTMTVDEVDEIRLKNHNITVSRLKTSQDHTYTDIPKPIHNFDQCFQDYPDLMAEIKKQNFTEPSPIQKQGWPILLKGEDMIGIAQTGTGKTLAFLLPALIHTVGQPIPREERNGPNILILAPTRELALQIEKEVKKYSFRGIRALCLYGGDSRRDQIAAFKKGAECIICTPGRLNDLIQAKVVDITSVTYLILDEADRMLDLGFEPQIRKILLDIRSDRQTVMTSATWPESVRRLAESYMVNPIQVLVGSLDLTATHTVKQIVVLLEEEEKFQTILKFLQGLTSNDKVIIFCSKRARADDLSSDLSLKGLSTQCIHGSRDQADREQAIADITSGDILALVATDVASRGLDIDDITHVINFDFPQHIEEYVHRVGRTGRAGRSGTSISYITRSDWGMAKDLIDILEKGEQEVPEGLRTMSQRFAEMKKRRGGNFKGCRGNARRY